VERRLEQVEHRAIKGAEELVRRVPVSRALVDEQLAPGLDGDQPDHLGEAFRGPMLAFPTGSRMDSQERPPRVPTEPG